MDAVSVWRSVRRVGGFLGDGGAGGLIVGDGLILGAGGEQRGDGEPVDGAGHATGVAVDDADGVGGQGVGSADVGQVRPDVPVGLGRGGVCHEWAARIAAQDLDGRVFPTYTRTPAPPYAKGFLDAAVSYDAYHYSGTRDLCIGYYSRFVKPGGVIGFVVPGMSAELDTLPPPDLADHRTRDTWDMCAFHS